MISILLYTKLYVSAVSISWQQEIFFCQRNVRMQKKILFQKIGASREQHEILQDRKYGQVLRKT